MATDCFRKLNPKGSRTTTTTVDEDTLATGNIWNDGLVRCNAGHTNARSFIRVDTIWKGSCVVGGGNAVLSERASC